MGNLAAYRGPVGVEIAVQGRGLTKYDAITIGGEKTATRYLRKPMKIYHTSSSIRCGPSVQLIGVRISFDIGTFELTKVSMWFQTLGNSIR